MFHTKNTIYVKRIEAQILHKRALGISQFIKESSEVIRQIYSYNNLGAIVRTCP